MLLVSYSQNHLTKYTWPGLRVSDPGSPGKMGPEKLRFFWRRVYTVSKLTHYMILYGAIIIFRRINLLFMSTVVSSGQSLDDKTMWRPNFTTISKLLIKSGHINVKANGFHVWPRVVLSRLILQSLTLAISNSNFVGTIEKSTVFLIKTPIF